MPGRAARDQRAPAPGAVQKSLLFGPAREPRACGLRMNASNQRLPGGADERAGPPRPHDEDHMHMPARAN